jgi:hypothetical protein
VITGIAVVGLFMGHAYSITGIAVVGLFMGKPVQAKPYITLIKLNHIQNLSQNIGNLQSIPNKKADPKEVWFRHVSLYYHEQIYHSYSCYSVGV